MSLATSCIALKIYFPYTYIGIVKKLNQIEKGTYIKKIYKNNFCVFLLPYKKYIMFVDYGVQLSSK